MINWEGKVPDVTDWSDPVSVILEVVSTCEHGLLAARVLRLISAHTDPSSTALSIICESVDTLIQDYGSLAHTYKQLKALMSIVQGRSTHSRLFLSVSAESPLIPLLSTPSFSPSISWIALHSPLLIRHLAVSYLMPPPPHSPPEKFWALFSPAAARGEGERLVFSSSLTVEEDEIVQRGFTEGVVEVVTRGVSSVSSKRGVERTIEGWRLMNSQVHVQSVPWNELASLSDISPKLRAEPTSPEVSGPTLGLHSSSAIQTNPMISLSFNLNLTDKQHAARSEVPLPYAHRGMSYLKCKIMIFEVYCATGQTTQDGLILYDPDSADDVDDDDPDEDLDI